jgi:hypothetical protein
MHQYITCINTLHTLYYILHTTYITLHTCNTLHTYTTYHTIKKMSLLKTQLTIHTLWALLNPLLFVQDCRVTRFFLVQHTKMGKMYQISTKYIKWSYNLSNGCKIYQVAIAHTNVFHSKALQNTYTKVGIFGMQIYHLSTQNKRFFCLQVRLFFVQVLPVEKANGRTPHLQSGSRLLGRSRNLLLAPQVLLSHSPHCLAIIFKKFYNHLFF